MSDEKPPQPPQKPTAKTSTVPLKKETVRITLKAKPGTGTPNPTASAGAPAPPTPPAPPGAPRPPLAPKTVPLAMGAPRPPAGAKTVPLTAAPPAARIGAPIAQPTARIGAPAAPAAPGAKPLPKATVQLQATQPMAARPTAQIQTGGIKTGAIRTAPASQMLEDEDEETGIMPFAVIALLIAIAVLCIELFSSPKFMPSALAPDTNPFERKTDTGYHSNFKSKLPDIPSGPGSN